MIGHHHESMKTKFSSCSIVAKHSDEQCRGAFRLQKIPPAPCTRGNEKCAFPGDSIRWAGMTLRIRQQVVVDGD